MLRRGGFLGPPGWRRRCAARRGRAVGNVLQMRGALDSLALETTCWRSKAILPDAQEDSPR
jgi:hypothetical protein